MILLDTSVLVDAFTGRYRSAPVVRAAIDRGDRLALPALVVYEWLRGPRTATDLEVVEQLFPAREALAFGPEEARVAARLFGQASKPRGRSVDIAVAAHAAVLNAEVWTLNVRDFDDLPGVRASDPTGS